MSYISNVTILAKYLDPEVNDALLNFTSGEDCAGFRQVDRHAGGGKIYKAYIWSTAVDWLNVAYRDDLYMILKGLADDCYLYEQSEDTPARIFYLDTWGWKQIN